MHPSATPQNGKFKVVSIIGIAQTIAWASTYYLPAVLAEPIARDFGLRSSDLFGLFSLALIVAALAGPLAGRLIDRFGGKPVLAGTSILFALCLVLMSNATVVWHLVLAWLGIGVGIASGLYEAAFATVVRLYGQQARSSITGITLIAGFASTIGWPLTSYMEATYDWRVACLIWAAMNAVVCLPLYGCLPKEPRVEAPLKTKKPTEHKARSRDARVWLLSFMFAATGFSSVAMAAHLPGLLQAAGISAASAIFVGMLIGPSQVGARLLEFTLLKKLKPLFSAKLAVSMHPIGALLLLLFGAPLAVIFGVLHGAGNGMLTIVKGALPLDIFGSHGYGQRQGILMAPARISQALAPWLFGLVVTNWGASALFLTAILGVLSLLSLQLLGRHHAG
ncbi:MFS transporter [Comamonas sp. NoAH]|uniref:MFS transporter n=1 Tax=Comamonas halotolerans TaxID=3041496 RepID=UPI0024E12805|nr:MFS transporter [Comamonas sp. NoAH]